MPEIWYVKKSIVFSGRIDLLLNLHNDEDNEYIDTQVSTFPGRLVLERLFSRLEAETTFDPNRPLSLSQRPDHTTNYLFEEHGIPVATMEQRIAPSKKLGRQAALEDRLRFGRQLVTAMA